MVGTYILKDTRTYLQSTPGGGQEEGHRVQQPNNCHFFPVLAIDVTAVPAPRNRLLVLFMFLAHPLTGYHHHLSDSRRAKEYPIKGEVKPRATPFHCTSDGGDCDVVVPVFGLLVVFVRCR